MQIEWLRVGETVLSGLGGFGLGIIAEPLKKIANDSVKRQNLRRALYAETAYNYSSIYPLLFVGPPECLPVLMQKFDQNIKRVARLETFEYVKSQNELSFAIPEWNQFISLYSFLLDIVNSQQSSELKARQGVTWLGMVEACTIEPLAFGTTLDIDMFRKVNRGVCQLFSDIKLGKRQRATDRFKEVAEKSGIGCS